MALREIHQCSDLWNCKRYGSQISYISCCLVYAAVKSIKQIISFTNDLQLIRMYLKSNYLAYVKVFNIKLWTVFNFFTYDYKYKPSSL